MIYTKLDKVFFPIKKLSGFISLWIIFKLCKYSILSKNCNPIKQTVFNENLRLHILNNFSKLLPKSSITKQSQSSNV